MLQAAIALSLWFPGIVKDNVTCVLVVKLVQTEVSGTQAETLGLSRLGPSRRTFLFLIWAREEPWQLGGHWAPVRKATQSASLSVTAVTDCLILSLSQSATRFTYPSSSNKRKPQPCHRIRLRHRRDHLHATHPASHSPHATRRRTVTFHKATESRTRTTAVSQSPASPTKISTATTEAMRSHNLFAN